jgi:hypothetical protein
MNVVLFGCKPLVRRLQDAGGSDGALSSCRVALECRVHGNALSKLA